MDDSNSILEQRKGKLASKFKGLLSDKSNTSPTTESNQEVSANSDVIEIRKQDIINKLKTAENSNWLYYLLLLPIIAIGWFIRTRNLPILQGKYLLGLDPYFFYRLSNTIVETGVLPAVDMMRYSPLGFETARFSFIAHFLAYGYKFFSIFNSEMTVIQWHAIYPPVVTIISFLVFFLFVRELLGNKKAILATAFLSVIPAYIYRTGAGFADHEAMAMMFMFISFFLFVKMWKSDKLKSSLIFGSLTGLFFGFTEASWGGSKFMTLSIGIFVILVLILNGIKRKQFVGYFSVFLTYLILSDFIHLGTFELAKLTNMITIVLATPIIIYIFSILISKINTEKIEKYIPKRAIPAMIIGIVGGIPATIVGIIPLSKIFIAFSGAVREHRFRSTVSESQIPFILSGGGMQSGFGWTLMFVILGAIILFLMIFYKSKISKQSKKYLALLGSSYSLFLFVFFMSRLSPRLKIDFLNSTFFYWLIFFVVSIILLYFYMYIKDKKSFDELFKVNWQYLLIFIWFMLSLLMARGSTRLIFALVPPAAIIISNFLFSFEDIFKKYNAKKIITIIIILMATILLFSNYSTALNINKSMGTGLPGQWEDSMNWIKTNTPEDAVIAHWWDYGYWTQTVGERASVTDGGNLRGWNHASGRYLMTGTNDTTTLEYLKTHETDYFLFSEEEIGKYHAFSLIGSDENYDRLSTIGVYALSDQQEIRDGIRMVYTGNWGLDKDYVINDLVLQEGKAGVGAFTMIVDENNTISDPKTIIIQNGNQYEFDINCVYVDGEKLEFEGNNSFEGCLAIKPYIQGQNQINPIGAAFWTSEKVMNGNFAKLYLFGEESEYFEEVYDDGTPLGLYQGRMIGPIKIWKINYPEDVVVGAEKYLEKHAYG